MVEGPAEGSLFMFRVVVAIVFIVLTFAVCRRVQKSLNGAEEERGRWPRAMLWILAAAWVFAVVYFAFLIRQPGEHGGVNTQPFWEVRRAFRLLGPSIFDGIRIASRTVFMDIVLNILLFVPFGMMLPVLFPRMRRIFVVPLGFLGSVCIEGFQYITHLGMADVDDLINNTIGTLLGLIIYLLFIRSAGKSRKDTDKFDI